MLLDQNLYAKWTAHGAGFAEVVAQSATLMWPLLAYVNEDLQKQ